MRGAVELIFRDFVEGQAQLLPGHDQCGPEDLRHIIEIAEHENVVNADHEPDLGRKDVHHVAAAPALPGTFRDLKQLLARREGNWQQRRAGARN